MHVRLRRNAAGEHLLPIPEAFLTVLGWPRDSDIDVSLEILERAIVIRRVSRQAPPAAIGWSDKREKAE